MNPGEFSAIFPLGWPEWPLAPLGHLPPWATCSLVPQKPLSPRWSSPPPNGEWLPILGDRTLLCTLAWVRAGEGAEDKGQPHLQTGGSWRQGLVLSHMLGDPQKQGGVSSLSSSPGSYVEVCPSAYLGFRDESSCLLKKKKKASSTNWAKGQGLK